MINELMVAIVDSLKHIEIYKLLITILVFVMVRQFLILFKQWLQLRETKTISELSIDNVAIEAWDNLIKSALDEYKIFNLNIKNLDYITSKEEQEIIEYMQHEVPSRIPMILLKKLECNINSEFIGTYIGTRIYMIVLDFVLEFNTANQTK